ncbi:uroporphyrinogen decarboxylase [Chryseobacterium koreense]
MSPEITNFVGYGASFFVVLSFILKDLRKIRIVNLVGCMLFVLYGIYSNYLWPIIIPNAILCGIQVFHLAKKKSE